MSAPFYWLATRRGGGNHTIHLMMDSNGEKFIYKMIFYGPDSRIGHETALLTKAEQMGHPNFVRPIHSPGTIWGAFREFLAVRANGHRLLKEIMKSQLPLAERTRDVERYVNSMYGLGDNLADHGFIMPIPDFHLDEVLFVQTPAGLRVKLTDMEHGGYSLENANARSKNRKIIRAQIISALGIEPSLHPLDSLNLAIDLMVPSKDRPLGVCGSAFVFLTTTHKRFVRRSFR